MKRKKNLLKDKSVCMCVVSEAGKAVAAVTFFDGSRLSLPRKVKRH